MVLVAAAAARNLDFQFYGKDDLPVTRIFARDVDVSQTKGERHENILEHPNRFVCKLLSAQVSKERWQRIYDSPSLQLLK